MPSTLVDYYALLPVLMLVLARLSGLVITAPLFNSRLVSRGVKAFLTFSMTLAILPSVIAYVPKQVTLSQALTGMLGELAIGTALGLALQLILVATQLAGATAAIQSGMSFAQSVDPMTETSSSDIGQIFFVLASLLFIAIGGPLETVRTLLDSFRLVPPLAMSVTEGSLFELVASQLTGCFSLALQLAAPCIIAVLLTTLAIGFLSRTVPQLHILSFGLPVQILVAVIVLMGTLPLAMSSLEVVFGNVFETMRDVLASAGR